MESVREKYFKALYRDNFKIDIQIVQQVQRGVSPEVDEIYVPLTVSSFKDNSVLTFEPIHETELPDAKDLESGEEVEKIVRNPSKESFSNLRIQDALKRNQRLVILGDTG